MKTTDADLMQSLTHLAFEIGVERGNGLVYNSRRCMPTSATWLQCLTYASIYCQICRNLHSLACRRQSVHMSVV